MLETLKKSRIATWLRAAGLSVCLVGALAGCSIPKSTSEDLVNSYAAAPGGTKTREIDQLNDQIFASANITQDPSDYLLGPGDLIEVVIFEADELNTTARVSSRGFITLPLLDQVEVKDLSAHEAEQFIEERYKETYIKDPHVSIFVKEHFSQRITLVGEIKNPGTYDYMAKQRLLDVLALAGGLTEKAGPYVQVRRAGADSGQRNVFMVDLEKLIKEGARDLNIAVNGGDMIFVAEAGRFFVDGAVRQPGSFPLKSKMTLREALLLAGGLAPYAEKDSITLIRASGVDGREIIRLDLGQDPMGAETLIEDNDVIIAKDSAWGKMVHGSGFNIGVPGFFGVGYRDPAR